jgi:hypothetical protein
MADFVVAFLIGLGVLSLIRLLPRLVADLPDIGVLLLAGVFWVFGGIGRAIRAWVRAAPFVTPALLLGTLAMYLLGVPEASLEAMIIPLAIGGGTVAVGQFFGAYTPRAAPDA